MEITVRPVTLENLEEEMAPCLEDVPPEKRGDYAAYCEAKRRWFKEATERYGMCGFVAYLDGRPTGLVEFLPVDAVPYPGQRPVDTVFILCMYVGRDSQKKGVGGKIMRHLIQYLRSDRMPSFHQRKAAALEVYVPERDPGWPPHIQFPTGSKEFYEKFGFSLKKKLPDQNGYLYRLEL